MSSSYFLGDTQRTSVRFLGNVAHIQAEQFQKKASAVIAPLIA
jgi:hypothetical protein